MLVLSWVGKLLLLAMPAVAHHLMVNGGTRECFHENLHKEDKMTVSYLVSPLENDAGELTDPNGRNLQHNARSNQGEFSFTAENDGIYRYCFSNEFEHSGYKDVTFNVHGVVYVASVENDPSEDGQLEREVKSLAFLLETIRDEQEYIVVREKTHRNTAESTNSRVKWWGIFQTGVVGGVCVFQVLYLKRFFEVKRVV